VSFCGYDDIYSKEKEMNTKPIKEKGERQIILITEAQTKLLMEQIINPNKKQKK